MATELDEQASEVAKECARAILADVATRTPADVSKAISNWQVSIGSPVDSEIKAHSPGAQGSTAQSSIDTTYKDGVAAMENKKPGETIFISNVTEYIEYLNKGSSTQQPAGFVQRAVMLGRKKVKNTNVRLVKNGR